MYVIILNIFLYQFNLFKMNLSKYSMAKRVLYLNADNSVKELYNLDGDAIKNDWQDSGVDLHFPETIILPPKKMTKVSLKTRAAVYNINATDEEPSKPYYLYPRSSIGKTPLRLANSVGIIDSQYRGELCVQIDNTSDEPYEIKRGQRLFQICAQDLEPFVSVKFTDVLSTTQRGANGFGSTGSA